MSLISLIVLLVVVGFILWAIERYIPMEATMKRILIFVVIIVVCIYLLTAFGLLPDLGVIKIGK